MLRRTGTVVAVLGLSLALAGGVAARNINANNAYVVTKLVSDQAGVAMVQDTNLVNGWGITAGATTPWWVANNATNTSTLYNTTNGTITIVPVLVNVAGAPTGTVFNGNTGAFLLPTGGAARFLFATESGTILGWNGAQGFAPGTAVEKVHPHDGAIYKGLAIDSPTVGTHLFATDFHNARIDVFDGSFAQVTLAGNFVDPGIPAGFAPFGIQNLNGVIYVTYAKQDADAHDEIAGEGLGYVSAFNTDGTFIGRVASGGSLNAPWGLAWAPGDFGRFSNNLLVGNFGDGRISGFKVDDGAWEAHGLLNGPDHHRISIDGLWGLGFGNGAASGPRNTLYFAAGPDDETHGLFGSIAAGS